MTIAELIHKLSKFPAGAEVWCASNSTSNLGDVASVNFSSAEDSDNEYGSVNLIGNAEDE